MKRGKDDDTKRVGIITGKFKPPHAGHYRAISKIAKENDDVYVFVSPTEIDGITGKKAVKVLVKMFENDPKVHIIGSESSPVEKAYELVDVLGKKRDAVKFRVNVYATKADLGRFKDLEKFAGEIGSIQRIETERPKGLSGTKMRELMSSNEKEKFIKKLPKGIDGELVWSILKGERINETGEYSVPANSFDTPKQYDFNVQPELVAPNNFGAVPQQWVASNPYSRWDMTTNPIAQTAGRNPAKLQKQKIVKTFQQFCSEMEPDASQESPDDAEHVSLYDQKTGN